MNTKKKKALPKKTEEKMYNVLFCGTGGQGVLTAAEIAGIAAMNAGYHVKKSEVHGMAQRGGSVESHLRFGSLVFAPLITPGNADYLVCFHDGEAERTKHFLSKKGINFLPFLKDKNNKPSDARFGNTFYLGILSAFLPLSEDNWTNALSAKLKRNLSENLKAFSEGRVVGLAAGK